MLDDDLLDELYLFVYPLTRGSGPKLFEDGDSPRRFALRAVETYPNGVTYLALRRES